MALIGLTYFSSPARPRASSPLDRAYFIAAISLPPGATLERTDAVRRAADLLLKRPGVGHAVAFAGFDGGPSRHNAGVIFVTLKPFEERVKDGLATTTPQRSARPDAGCARHSCWSSAALRASESGPAAASSCPGPRRPRFARSSRRSEPSGSANQTPGLVQVFTLFNTKTPQVYADIDRTSGNAGRADHALLRHALDLYGLDLVNDFNILGRTYRVTAQADNRSGSVRGVENLRTRSSAGDMVPLGSVATFKDITGPYGCRATTCSRPPR